MFSRRGILGWMLARPRPRLAFAREVSGGVVFRRAYAAFPEDGMRPLLTGCFPHLSPTPEPLTRFFDLVETPDERTIVVATGAPSGPGWDERAVRVPLTIRFPGMLEDGIANDVLISTVDILATILSLAGIPIPEEVHGRVVSLSAPPPAIFAEGALRKPGEWRMIVRGYDKMVTDAKLQPTHLFNLADDPQELDDLAKRPGQRLRVDELRALLLDWRKRTGDGVDASGLRRRR